MTAYSTPYGDSLQSILVMIWFISNSFNSLERTFEVILIRSFWISLNLFFWNDKESRIGIFHLPPKMSNVSRTDSKLSFRNSGFFKTVSIVLFCCLLIIYTDIFKDTSTFSLHKLGKFVVISIIKSLTKSGAKFLNQIIYDNSRKNLM